MFSPKCVPGDRASSKPCNALLHRFVFQASGGELGISNVEPTATEPYRSKLLLAWHRLHDSGSGEPEEG